MEVTLAQIHAQQSEILAVLTEIYKLNALIATFAVLGFLWIACFSFWKFLRMFI